MCNECKSDKCLGSFHKRGLRGNSLADLATKLNAMAGTRKGVVHSHTRTPYAYFHLNDSQFRIHSNCDCEWLRYLARNIDKAGGTTQGVCGGTVLNIQDAPRFEDGYYIYAHK